MGDRETEVGENSEEAVCNRESVHSLKVWTPVALPPDPHWSLPFTAREHILHGPKQPSFILSTSHSKIIYRLVSSERNLILIPIPHSFLPIRAAPRCSRTGMRGAIFFWELWNNYMNSCSHRLFIVILKRMMKIFLRETWVFIVIVLFCFSKMLQLVLSWSAISIPGYRGI